MSEFLYAVSEIVSKGGPYVEIVLFIGVIASVIFTFSTVRVKTDNEKTEAQ
jgi:hypothetical protein